MTVQSTRIRDLNRAEPRADARYAV